MTTFGMAQLALLLSAFAIYPVALASGGRHYRNVVTCTAPDAEGQLRIDRYEGDDLVQPGSRQYYQIVLSKFVMVQGARDNLISTVHAPWHEIVVHQLEGHMDREGLIRLSPAWRATQPYTVLEASREDKLFTITQGAQTFRMGFQDCTFNW